MEEPQDLALGAIARIDGHDTLPRLLRARASEMGEATAHREKALGIWHAWSWSDTWANVRLWAMALAGLGLARGEVVAILSEDRREWLYADLATQGMGGIATGIYTTDAPAQVAHVLRDSGARILVVENDEQLDKFLSVEGEVPHVEHVIVLNDDGLGGFSHPRVTFLDDLYRLGQTRLRAEPDRFDAEVERGRPDDVAMLVYTSGTTGAPKGAMLTQGNLMAAAVSVQGVLPLGPGDEIVCFLPLCHVFERIHSGVLPIAARATVNFAESPETVFDNTREVSPHGFIGVPRLWEKMHARVSVMLSEATPFQRWAFGRALAAGRAVAEARAAGRAPGALATARLRFWDAAVLSNLRRMLGLERVRQATSGAAPLAPELIAWFRAVGVPLYEGFGMSETSAVATGNVPGADRLGTVGRPVPGMEARLGEGGELLLRGPSIFAGYWGLPDKTAETFDGDWLRTGDQAAIDADGYVTITGRLKDIIITAGGKNVAPAEIENRLKASPHIADAVVIGDARKYLTCLVMIDQETVEIHAQANRVPFSDFRTLCRAPEVRALIGEAVQRVNADLARVEQIKDFRIIDVVLNPEDEELTATMKLKRGVVARRHSALIDEMYGTGREAPAETKQGEPT